MIETKSKLSKKPKATAGPEPLAKPGHGLPSPSQKAHSAGRLRRLLNLSADVPMAALLRDAGDEIVRLRSEPKGET